jgi:hypothetical protein
MSPIIGGKVRIWYRSAAIAAAFLLTATTTLAMAGSAGASSGEPINNNCPPNGGYINYCFLEGTGFDGLIAMSPYVYASDWIQVDKSTWPGIPNRTIYEYEQVGTNLCITYDGKGEDVYLTTCTAGRESSEFWRGPSGDTLVNVYATSGGGQYGKEACLDGQGGDWAFIQLCDGSDTQVWNW